MRITITVDTALPRWLRRLVAISAVPALALAAATVHADVPLTEFKKDDPLSAKAMNDNFNALGDAVTALQSNVSTNLVENVSMMRQHPLVVTDNGSWSTVRAVGIPYKTLDGTWRLRFNIVGNTSNKDSTIIYVQGIQVKQSAEYYQNISVSGGDHWNSGYCTGNPRYPQGNSPTDRGAFDVYCANSTTRWALSGDIELDAEPTLSGP